MERKKWGKERRDRHGEERVRKGIRSGRVSGDQREGNELGCGVLERKERKQLVNNLNHFLTTYFITYYGYLSCLICTDLDGSTEIE